MDDPPGDATHPVSVGGCFPDLATAGVARRIDEGWDAEVLLLEDAMIVRLPRRTEVQAAMRIEGRLLAQLEGLAAVPAPALLRSCDAHGSMVCEALPGHALTGELLDRIDRSLLVEQLARFLEEVWSFPRVRAMELGVRRPDLGPTLDEFRNRVLPAIDDHRAARVLDHADEFLHVPGLDEVLVHGDLGPAHLLCTEAGLAGVIDWSDASIGDPATDLAWLLNGFDRQLRAPLIDRLDLDTAAVARADVRHQLGPWWEILHGLDHDPAFLASGIAGARARLDL